MCFKSSMEANIYRYFLHEKLTKGKIKAIEYEQWVFEFDPQKNKFGIRWYIPDFRIVFQGYSYFVEVKGYMDEKSIEKARLFKENYGGIKLLFIGPEKYQLIKNNYAKNIPNWE